MKFHLFLYKKKIQLQVDDFFTFVDIKLKYYEYTLLFPAVCFNDSSIGQKIKIKGSKIVTTEQRKNYGDFESLTVEDNIEVYLEGERQN
jgi:hypothetical protein